MVASGNVRFGMLVVGFALVARVLMGPPGAEAVRVPVVQEAGEIRHDVLSPWIERVFNELGVVPGMAVAVVRDTSVILLQGFGVTDVSSRNPVTPETPFYIASSTKSFMGTASAVLEAEGLWSLDDPLSRFLPSLTLPEPLSSDSVTLRQLLSHTSRIESGPIVFRTAFSGEHDAEVLLRLLEGSSVLEPGFDYGNIGYVVASLAMDRATGTPWQDVLERTVFEPLGMRRTSARRSDFEGVLMALPHGVPAAHDVVEVRRYIKTDENMHAAGGMITTARDLARWLEANLDEGRVDGRSVLPAEAIAESQRLQAQTEASFHAFERTGYGLGWYHSRYDGDFVLHHFGNYPGFRAHVSFMPEPGIGVAVMTNESAQGYFMPEVVATSVYDILLGKPDLDQKTDSVMGFLRQDAARIRAAVRRDFRERAQRPDTLALPLAAYSGTYTSPVGGTFDIEDSGVGRLRATIGVLTSLVEPIDGENLTRVELVPGSGETIRFFVTNEAADSLVYGGQTFRKR